MTCHTSHCNNLAVPEFAGISHDCHGQVEFCQEWSEKHPDAQSWGEWTADRLAFVVAIGRDCKCAVQAAAAIASLYACVWHLYASGGNTSWGIAFGLLAVILAISASQKEKKE